MKISAVSTMSLALLGVWLLPHPLADGQEYKATPGAGKPDFPAPVADSAATIFLKLSVDMISW